METGTTRAGADGGTSVADDPAVHVMPAGSSVGVHDLLSLGFIAEALQLSSGGGTSTGTCGSGRRLTDEEARRLPLLLRLLASARPLTSAENDTAASEADTVVPLLERVAASHPQAELIELLLGNSGSGPSAGLIGRIPPLSRRALSTASVADGGGSDRMLSREWDTSHLRAALAGKEVDLSGDNSEVVGGSDEINNSDDEDDNEEDDGEGEPVRKKAKTANKEESTGMYEQQHPASADEAVAASKQDTTEATLSRTLREVAELVLASLDPPIEVDVACLTSGGGSDVTMLESHRDVDAEDGNAASASNDNNAMTNNGEDEGVAGDGGDEARVQKTAPVLLKLEPDSLLAEDDLYGHTTLSEDHDDEGGTGDGTQSAGVASFHGYGAGSELKATMACLLQQTPALRYRHVANALCRSAAPQAAVVITSLASNCPQASPCLLAGCIDAAAAASASSNDDDLMEKVLKTAKASARALADLSTAEAWNVADTLSQYRVMGDVALDLLITLDPSAAVAAVREDLLVHNEALQRLSAELHRAPKHSTRSCSKKRQRRRIRPNREIRTEIAAVRNNTPWIVGELAVDDELARKMRKCILDTMESCYNGEDVPSLGKAILVVRTLALVVHSVGIGSGSSFGSGSAFVQSSMNAIDIINGKFSEKASDDLRTLSICACILTCSKFPPIADAKQTFINSPASAACSACLLGLLDPIDSADSDNFAGRVVSYFLSQDGSELERLVVGRVLGLGAEQTACPGGGFFNTCRWASSKIDTGDAKQLSRKALDSIVGLFDGIRRGSISSQELGEGAKKLFDDPERCRRATKQAATVGLIENTVNAALSEAASKIPLVLPLHVGALSQKLSWRQSDLHDAGSEATRCQLVIQLLYSLLFLEKSPSSPFVIDPRAFPLAEVCAFCQESSLVCDEIASRIQSLTAAHVPDVLSTTAPVEPDIDNIVCGGSNRKISIAMVTGAIEACRNESASNDANALARRAELLYLRGRADFPSNDVDTAVACALISSAHLPPRAYSYSLLCKDPLLILKCHLSVWKCPGLRRIVIAILRRLLEANNDITLQDAPTEEAGQQMLAARDSLVARCLLIFACNSFVLDADTASEKAGSTTRCSATIAFVRSLVANRPGVVATLVKQSLPNKAVDWLIEISPECFGDAKLLIGSLSDRTSTLTAAERMVTADAALRIAIAHGSQDNAVAQQLSYAALNTLVASFFLSLGPVGVPVNILHEDDGREDVTQTCRRATFRMLSAIQSLENGRVQMANEARRVLSKLAVMSKSENALGGASGSVATRRKALLKDLWDSIVLAGNALGGGLTA